MGLIKTYMIVTNDEYEYPVKTGLKGAKKAAEFLGVTTNSLRQNICRGRWGKQHKYKAVIDTSVVNEPKENRKKYAKMYRMTHDKSEYHKAYYQRKKAERLISRAGIKADGRMRE